MKVMIYRMVNGCKDDDDNDDDFEYVEDEYNFYIQFLINSILLFIGFEDDSFCVLVLIEFNITFIETVILVLSELEEDEEVSLFVIQSYWEVLEEMVEGERVLFFGIVDLNKEQLEELYNWVKVIQLN